MGLSFSSKLDWRLHIIAIARTASKKFGAIIHSMKFLSPEVAFSIQPCLEYCYHVRAGAPSCYSEMLDKLQRQIYRPVTPSLVGSLETLAHCQNVTSFSCFYRYYFARCSSELVEMVPLPE